MFTAQHGRRLELRFLPVLILILSAFVAAFSGRPQPAAEEPDDPIPTDPFEAPSAAYEAYRLREAGLMEGPPPAGPPSEGPGPALGLFAVLSGDVVVNNPGDDAPENTTQSETTLAVLGDTLIAGYNNSGPGGFSGLSRSTDLGAIRRTPLNSTRSPRTAISIWSCTSRPPSRAWPWEMSKLV